MNVDISVPRSARARVARRLRALAAPALLALALPGAAHADCHFRALLLPVTIVGARALTTVGIEGNQVQMMVDTGAFYSMLSEPAARQMSLPLRHAPDGLRIYGLNGIIDTRMTTVKKLGIGKGELANIDFLVGGNDTGHGNTGLLGRNLLTSTDLELDMANGKLRLMFPNDDCQGDAVAYWAGDTPVTVMKMVAYEDAYPKIEADVLVNGHKVRALFDSGASTILSRRAARDAGIADADMTPGNITLGAGHGEGKSWNARVDKMDFGGEVITNSRIDIGDFTDPEMLIGMDFFLSHRLYVSLKQHRIYATYNGGQVFARNRMAESAASAPADDKPLADAASYLNRGTARATRHDFANALADLDRACEMAPTTAENFLRRGEVHWAMAQLTLALADFDTAVRLDPASGESLIARARLHLAMKRRDDALADLQAMQGSVAPQSNLHRDMGGVYMALDLPAQAIPQLDQWLEAHRRDAQRAYVLNERCWARVRLGTELDKALADCDDALDMAPENPALYGSRGWAHLRRGQWREAQSDFDRAIKLHPDGTYPLYGRALVRSHLGQADGARADFEAARKLDAEIDAKVRHDGIAGDLVAATK